MNFRKGFWRPKTYQGHKSMIDTFFTWLGFDDFNNKALKNFFLHLMQTKSPTTYKNYRTVLKQLFTEALDLSKEDIGELFKGIKPIKSNPTPLNPFSNSNVERMKNAILEHQPKLWLVCLLQYYCFIRPGEIRCLKVGDVILEEEKIIVDASISKNKKTRYPVYSSCFYG